MELTYEELLSFGFVRKLVSCLWGLALSQDVEDAYLNSDPDADGNGGLYSIVRVITLDN